MDFYLNKYTETTLVFRLFLKEWYRSFHQCEVR